MIATASLRGPPSVPRSASFKRFYLDQFTPLPDGTARAVNQVVTFTGDGNILEVHADLVLA